MTEHTDGSPIGQVLPLFQGHRPRHALAHVTGQSDQTRRALDLDDEVLIIARVKCVGIKHKRDKEGVLGREETLQVAEAYELGDALDGKAVMDSAREESETLKRRVFGYEPSLLDT
jgi:hypothetical protein